MIFEEEIGFMPARPVVLFMIDMKNLKKKVMTKATRKDKKAKANDKAGNPSFT